MKISHLVHSLWPFQNQQKVLFLIAYLEKEIEMDVYFLELFRNKSVYSKLWVAKYDGPRWLFCSSNQMSSLDM